MNMQRSSFRFFVVAAVLGTGLGTAAPASAQYGGYGGEHYRVVDVFGDDQVNVHARPQRFARVVGYLPFNARLLEATGRQHRRWAEVVYDGRYGWVHRRHLAEDHGDKLTYYATARLDDYASLNIRRRASRRSRVLGQIPHDASDVLNCGPCRKGWCPIRYHGVDGWVRQRYLVVQRTRTYREDEPYQDDDQHLSDDRTDDYYDRYKPRRRLRGWDRYSDRRLRDWERERYSDRRRVTYK